MASCSSSPPKRARTQNLADNDSEVDDLIELLMFVFQDPHVTTEQKNTYVDQTMPLVYAKKSIGRKEMAFWEYLFSDRVHPSYTHMKWTWEHQDHANNYYCAFFVPKPRSQGYLRIVRSFKQNGYVYKHEFFCRRGSSKYLFYLMLKMAKSYDVQFVVHSRTGTCLNIVN